MCRAVPCCAVLCRAVLRYARYATKLLVSPSSARVLAKAFVYSAHLWYCAQQHAEDMAKHGCVCAAGDSD